MSANGWREIGYEAKSGLRILVMGGQYVVDGRDPFPQSFPSLVAYDGREWVVCDNEGRRAIIRHPSIWCPVPALA